MEATVFLISAAIVLVSGQAPSDIAPDCRTNHLYSAHHNWIPYVNDTSVGVRGNVKWQVLLDQYDYVSLFGTNIVPGVWTSRDFDNDGFEFTGSESECTSTLKVPRTSYLNSATDNWAFTQAVSYLDAVQVFVNVTFRFSACAQRANCTRSYVTLHRFDTNSSKGIDEVTTKNNYMPYLGDAVRSRFEQTTMESINIEIVESFDRPNADMTYFGIQDTGTIGEVTRIIIYYKVAQGFERGLVICPSIGLPRNGTHSGLCSCKSNASPLTDMTIVCDQNGMCAESASCGCNPGYGYDSTTMECRACPIGTYKADLSNAACRSCPTNSTTNNLSSTVCECRYGTVRNLSRPDDSCEAQDAFIRSAVVRDMFNLSVSCPALDNIVQSAFRHISGPNGSCQTVEAFIQNFNSQATTTTATELITITALATLYGLNLLHLA